MRTKLSRVAVLATLAVAASTLIVAGTAVAGATSVSGTQTVVDESAGTYEMHGSLVGSWQITSFVPHFQSPSQLVASGTETFVGCLDSNRNAACDKAERTGSMDFTFIYWATFNPRSEALLRGQCVHPIVGGTGGFVRAKGVLHMKDTPVGDTVRTTYTGTISSQ